MYKPWLYTLGSVIFLASSILFHPHFTVDPFIYLASVCGFVAGSLVFTGAGVLGVWMAMRWPASSVGAWGAAILSLIGALLLLAGSLAFWPGLGASGPVIGAYTFRAGSVAYILSSGWSLWEEWMAAPAPRRLGVAARWELFTLMSYAMGAMGFIAGGMRPLEEESVQGSILWALGSLMFLVGSAVPLSQPRGTKTTRLGAETIMPEFTE